MKATRRTLFGMLAALFGLDKAKPKTSRVSRAEVDAAFFDHIVRPMVRRREVWAESLTGEWVRIERTCQPLLRGRKPRQVLPRVVSDE